MSQEKTVTGLNNIIDEMGKLHKVASEQFQVFQNNFQKFTGFQPAEPMTAFKVLQMMRNIEGKKDAGSPNPE